MNLLLLAGGEVDARGRAELPADDRRARHVQHVLRALPGQSLRAGLLDGPLGTAVVERSDARGIALSCSFDAPAPEPRDVLVLAIPRPKVLLRCVEAAAALGFARIALVRTWRTDRSHVEASALARDALRARAILGLEQAQRTRVPRIEVFARFRPFVEDDLEAWCAAGARLLADPSAADPLTGCRLPDAGITLAIGPERGFTPYEVEQFGTRGFARVHAGRHPLRVETALAFVAGHVAALRARDACTGDVPS